MSLNFSNRIPTIQINLLEAFAAGGAGALIGIFMFPAASITVASYYAVGTIGFIGICKYATLAGKGVGHLYENTRELGDTLSKEAKNFWDSLSGKPSTKAVPPKTEATKDSKDRTASESKTYTPLAKSKAKPGSTKHASDTSKADENQKKKKRVRKAI